MTALKAADDVVYVLSGVGEGNVTSEDPRVAEAYLESVGITSAMYDHLILVADPHPKNKLKVIEELGIQVLVDNKKKTARKASKAGVFALVPWSTREK